MLFSRNVNTRSSLPEKVKQQIRPSVGKTTTGKNARSNDYNAANNTGESVALRQDLENALPRGISYVG